MSNIFSKRNTPLPDKFRYDFPPPVRRRILQWFKNLCGGTRIITGGGRVDAFLIMLMEVQDQLLLEYDLAIAEDWAGEGPPVVEHLCQCNDEKVIDFIELCFRSESYRAGQAGVDAINNVLREEGIGYEFSPYVERNYLEEVPHPSGRTDLMRKSVRTEREYPEATKKTNELVHQQVVMPSLQLLSGKRWETANHQMLKAHEHFRKGDWRSAINESSAALETTFKVICQEKKWPYTPNGCGLISWHQAA